MIGDNNREIKFSFFFLFVFFTLKKQNLIITLKIYFPYLKLNLFN